MQATAIRIRHVTARLALAGMILLAGCVMRHGPRVDQLRTANSGLGAQVRIQLRAPRAPRQITGELLEVRDTSVLVLDQEVWLIPQREIISIEPVEGALRIRSRTGDMTIPRTPQEWRLLSRFPQGMPDGVLARILSARGQTAPRAVSDSIAAKRQDEMQHDHEPSQA